MTENKLWWVRDLVYPIDTEGTLLVLKPVPVTDIGEKDGQPIPLPERAHQRFLACCDARDLEAALRWKRLSMAYSAIRTAANGQPMEVET